MSQDAFSVSHELVSALADGQLVGDEFAGLLASLAKSDEAVATWHSYHLVGDVLRCGDLAACRGDMDFVARLRGQLTQPVEAFPAEPLVMAGLLPARVLSEAVTPDSGALPPQGANDPVIRWKLVAGLASMVAVASLGWHLVGVDAGLPGSSQLALVPGGTTTAAASTALAGAAAMAEPPVMLRDARLDELLAAHKQFGGTSALQMPAGFLRNATFENTSR